MDARERLACYPRGTFYPLSYDPSTRDRRITRAHFRDCSTCLSCSKAGLCSYTRHTVSNRAEPTFALLRYLLGGDRPSQTAQHARSPAQFHGNRGEITNIKRVVFQGWLHQNRNSGFNASHLSYAFHIHNQYMPAVKVHGVFPSCCG